MTSDELLAQYERLERAKLAVVAVIETTQRIISDAIQAVAASDADERAAKQRILDALRDVDNAKEHSPLVGGTLCHQFAPPYHLSSECATDEPPSKPL